MKSLISITIFLLSATATAATVILPTVSPAAIPTPLVDEFQDQIPCDQIAARLENYRLMTVDQDQSVKSFLDELVTLIQGWYTSLSSITSVTSIDPKKTYEGIKTSAGQISNVLNSAYANSDLLAIEFQLIQSSLDQCNVTDK